MRTAMLAFGVVVSAMNAHAQSFDAPSPQWRIEITRPSREVIFTDLRTTHWACDTGARDQRAYAGLYTSMHESLDDYALALDGEVLDPARATKVTVTPWSMVREYDDDVRETVFLALGEAALFVRLERGSSRAERWSVTPRVDLRWIWKPEAGRYAVTATETVAARNRTLRTVTAQRVGWTPGPGGPDRVVLAAFGGEGAFTERQVPRPTTHPRDAARKAMERTTPVEIGTLEIVWAEGQRHVDLVFVPMRGEADDVLARMEDLLVRRDLLLAERRAYFEAMQERALRTGDERLDKTYLWARASMDQMIMHTRGAGIYAGFHWFTNFWGRDTFICLPGATLVTGRHDAAREILRSFLQFQLVDRDHPRQGRIPNIVQPDQLQYAGVDGTWWYARAAYRYLQARRAAEEPDEVFEREFTAALALMIDGAERHAVDAYGLLRHGDGETWMDAGGESNPYSPRGDRAVEVQALYYNALRIAERLAGDRGDRERATDYARLAERTGRAFASLFWIDDLGRLADHLDVDGAQDRQLRPNGILAITAVEPEWPPLLTEEQMRAEVEIVYEKLVRPWGVTSLDPADPDFRPRHLDLGNYYYDAAYHNGDVWYWLSGPMITALCRIGRVEDAVRMLDVLVRETLDHGAVGAIREIRDGADTGTTEEFGGATFQAWSMAELLRAMHEDLAPRLGWTR